MMTYHRTLKPVTVYYPAAHQHDPEAHPLPAGSVLEVRRKVGNQFEVRIPGRDGIGRLGTYATVENGYLSEDLGEWDLDFEAVPLPTLDGDGGTRPELTRLIERFPPVGVSLEVVPAGPERNAYRASLAATGLLSYAVRVYGHGSGPNEEPLEQTVRDFLTDLRYLCDLMDNTSSGTGFGFYDLVDRAREAYLAEQADERASST